MSCDGVDGVRSTASNAPIGCTSLHYRRGVTRNNRLTTLWIKCGNPVDQTVQKRLRLLCKSPDRPVSNSWLLPNLHDQARFCRNPCGSAALLPSDRRTSNDGSRKRRFFSIAGGLVDIPTSRYGRDAVLDRTAAQSPGANFESGERHDSVAPVRRIRDRIIGLLLRHRKL
jgi:hypothetical protein